MRSCRLSSIRPASTTDRVWKVPLTNRRSLRRRTPDGKHIAMFPVPAQAAQGPPRVTFILNFFDYLRRTVPQGKWSVRDTNLSQLPVPSGRSATRRIHGRRKDRSW